MWLGRRSQLLVPPDSSLPSALLVWMTSLHHGFVAVAAALPPGRDALYAAPCKQKSSLSQRANIRLWLLSLSNSMVWLCLEPLSCLGSPLSPISPVMSFNGKRKLYKGTRHATCWDSSSISQEASHCCTGLKEGREGSSDSFRNLQDSLKEGRPKGQLPCKRRAAWLTLWKENEMWKDSILSSTRKPWTQPAE